MSRILHHVGRNDFKKTRQRKIVEQKKLAAQKLKESQKVEVETKKIEEERRQIEEAAKPLKSDWRIELSEKMSTAGMGMVNYPATGDNDLKNVTKSAEPGTDGSGGSGGSYSFGSYDEAGSGGFTLYLNTGKYDTLKFNANKGSATRIEVSINGGSFQTLSNGLNLVNISAANRGTAIPFGFNVFKSGGSGSTGASISGVTFRRRNPVNVLVRLDDPESLPFNRGGLGGSQERRKQLKDKLDAGNRWMYIQGLEPSKTSPGDIELASADWPKGDPSKSPPPIYKPGGGGWPNVPGVPQPFRGQPGPKYPLANLNQRVTQIAGVPRNYPGEGAVPAYPSPRGPYTPIKNYGSDKNPKFMPSGPVINPYRLA